MFPIVIMAATFVILAGYQTYFVLRRRRLQNQTWEQLISKIQPVDFSQLQKVAKSYLESGKDHHHVQPADMWIMLGQEQGLARLRNNAEVMLDLAVYAERWNFHEGRVIADFMRRDSVRLRTALREIEASFANESRTTQLHLHLQEISSAYSAMRQRLLALYENANAGRLPQLQAAL